MKVLTVSLPKSGSSALYYKLKEAFPAATRSFFEPQRFEPSDSNDSTDVLAKIMISHNGNVNYASFRNFDKRILIVRDPRDHLISRLLFRPCNDPTFRQDPTMVTSFLETIRQKEAEPCSISVLDLLDRYHVLRRYASAAPHGAAREWTNAYRRALTFHQEDRALFTYKYEDFVTGRYSEIEDYLNVQLPAGTAIVALQHEYVTRTKQAGDWANWFTDEDVAFFRPLLTPYMAAYGYPDNWTLASKPSIPPGHGSDFVRRSVAVRRQEDFDLARQKI